MPGPRNIQEDDFETRQLLSGQGEAIPLFKVFMPESVMEPLREVLLSGYIGEGPKVKTFERQLSGWFGNPHTLALSNGTAAIQLALRLSNVGPGDEVISTPVTCVATNTPILAMGARIVWADIDSTTGNIDYRDVERKIGPRTKAIICVHWGGYPCELDELNKLAARHGIKLIEDACHAFGANYKGKPIGGHSDFACFSFQAIKEVTTVDGGALTCRAEEDYRRGKLLRWYGIDRTSNRKDYRCEEDIEEFGYKFHMNDVAATIGIEQLKYVQRNIEKVRKNASKYDEAFSSLATVAPLRYGLDRQSSYWLYTLLAEDRERFIKTMKEAKIVVSQVHARNDKHTMFRDFIANLPAADEFVSKQICIPVGWWLTDKERAHIIETILGYDRCQRQDFQPLLK